MKASLKKLSHVWSRKARNRTRKTLERLLDASAESRLSSSSEVQHYLGQCFFLGRHYRHAERAFRGALLKDAESAKHWLWLAKVLRAKNEASWEQVAAYRQAIALGARELSVFLELSRLLALSQREEEALSVLEQASTLQADSLDVHFARGCIHQRLEQLEQASSAFSEACRIHGGDAVRFGEGVIFEERNCSRDAEKAYYRRLAIRPTDQELLLRHAHSCERSFNLEGARSSYELVLDLDSSMVEVHRRLGIVLEHMGEQRLAADCFQTALKLCKTDSDTAYRLGVVRVRLNQLDEALEAFRLYADLISGPSYRQVLRRSREGSSNKEGLGYFRQAEGHVKGGDGAAASSAFTQAILRCPTHLPEWHIKLAECLFALGRREDACLAYQQSRKDPRASLLSSRVSNASESITQSYLVFSEVWPVQENLVLYESFGGRSISCNPLSILLAILDDPQYSSLNHAVVVESLSAIPLRLRGHARVIPVLRSSDAYVRHLATAKYLINNSTFPTYFIRRAQQRYLNTWHGTPLKAMGKDIRSSFMERKNTARNFLQSTHLLSPNLHTTRILTDRYDIDGIYAGTVAELGYPRIDRSLNATEFERSQLRERLGIREGAKVVLYAPTFRGALGKATQDIDIAREVVQKLSSLNCHVLFRGHYFVEKSISRKALSRNVVPEDVDSNLLLSIVDVLVTDYSSIAFDFLALHRPIVHYVPDLQEYRESRGMYLDMNELPGALCATLSEAGDAVAQALVAAWSEEQERHYSTARMRFCPFEDGNASQRVIKLLFGKDEHKLASQPRSKTNLLFHVGALKTNGITISALNLFTHLDREKYNIFLCFEPSGVASYPDRLECLARYPEWVHQLGRAGSALASHDERTSLGTLAKDFHSSGPYEATLIENYYVREYRRQFGDAAFDVLVNFSGYDLFWHGLFAFGGGEQAPRRVVYLHNDMHGEWLTRYPQLEAVFQLYRRYDAAVSVSEQTAKLNQEKLSPLFELPAHGIGYCENVHNPERVEALAKEPIAPEDQRFFDGPGRVFVTMGRLSLEKDHAKLVRAFDLLLRDEPDAQLIIVGEGPLLATLRQQVASLSREKNIHLAGRRSNPFNLMANADCFVLSSNYEGQPMVLFEALILGKPIVATDIVGSRSVLEGRPGLLVENSEQGLLAGFHEMIRTGFPANHFDIRAYQKSALAMFEEKVVGAARQHEV